MEMIKKIEAVLDVYIKNFKILHWLACGVDFDKQHNMAAEYYDKLTDDLDAIAEIGLRVDVKPVSYNEAYEILNKDHNSFLVLSTEENISFKDFLKYTDIMFKDLTTLIEDVLKSEGPNIGMKSYFENLYNEYDHIRSYLIKRYTL